jgi:hypothetical protein
MSRADDEPAQTTDDAGAQTPAPHPDGEPPGELPVAGSSPAPRPGSSEALVQALAASFCEQIRRALAVELSYDTGPTALAFVDHYLSLLRDETREPIVSLVAANAGAWFGELIRREVGGLWIGDGVDPRRLRLLLEPQFIYFAPVDMAYEAILSASPEPGDPRVPEGAILDSAFNLRTEPITPGEAADHDWISERLAEAPPLPEDQFFSLTGRFEVLVQILELLAAREQQRGREPTRYHLNDYLAALAPGTDR